MDLLSSTGSLITGILVIWIVMIFLRRFKTFDAKGLATVIAAIFGGAVFTYLVANDRASLWIYPVGLFLGFVVFQLYLIWEGETPIFGRQ
jgi:hypothetical protein